MTIKDVLVPKLIFPSREIVGFAQWQYPLTLSPEAESEKKHLDATREERVPLPEKANAALIKDFFGLLDVKRNHYTDQTKDYRKISHGQQVLCSLITRPQVLSLLGVAPAHQGKGAGSALIKRGLDDADANNARAYVEASPYGLPVYKKRGWKEIDRVIMDMSKYGGQGLAAEVLMMREPGGVIAAE